MLPGGFGPYWPHKITHMLQICQLNIRDINLPFRLIPKVLCWVEIWWKWRLSEYSELTVIVKNPLGYIQQQHYHLKYIKV